jgi:hypothetical protein
MRSFQWPGHGAMGDCQNDSVRSEGRIHNEEWQLAECVSSAAGEIDRPAMGSISDCSYRAVK